MAERQLYATRSGAVRAARDHCKSLLGPSFQAFEGPDYEIHPGNEDEAMEKFPKTWFWGYKGPSWYRLRGPAAEALLETIAPGTPLDDPLPGT